MAVSIPTSAKTGSGTWDGADLDHLTDISFTDEQELEVYATSGTAGQRTRLAGHQDSSGQFTMVVDPAAVGLNRGDVGVLTLSDSTGNVVFNGDAIIGTVERGIPIEDGTKLTWTVSWGQKPDASS